MNIYLSLKKLTTAYLVLISVAVLGSCSKDDDTTALTVNNYRMIATGQTKLYNADGEVVTGLNNGDAFYGQDANYLKGPVMSDKDNGDKTTTDLNTGLMWQQVPSLSGYTWHKL